MPIYEYQCAECGKVFEAFQKINDDPLTECKFCTGRVERLISQTSFQLKGGGWYVTDYAKRSAGSTSTAPVADTAKGDAAKGENAGKSSESKPDSSSKDSEKSSSGKT